VPRTWTDPLARPMKKPEGTRPLGRPWRGWEYNIKMDLHEVGWGDVD